VYNSAVVCGVFFAGAFCRDVTDMCVCVGHVVGRWLSHVMTLTWPTSLIESSV